MRLTAALAIPLLLSLAACGGGRPKGLVRFTGLAPNSSAQKAADKRTVTTTCPGCMRPIAFGAAKCGTKRCELQLSWDKEYACPSCNGSGTCSACVLLEQQEGKCPNCAGAGIKTFAGKTPECSNCKGKKVCPICDGQRKCDYCKGTGKLDDQTVQALSAKAAPKSDEDAKPEGGK
jgi:hypothetical protein